MVDFLSQKFMEKKDPVYQVNEIDVKQLEIARADARLKYYHPIKGSNTFQVNGILSQQHKHKSSWASLHMWSMYKNDCSSCDLYTDYTQVVQTLSKINRRSNYDENEKNEEHLEVYVH